MSKIEDLIKQYCPNGCEWKPLYEVTVWDKRFNSVERYKQPAVIDYKKYFLGEEQKRLVSENGSVKILTTYVSNLYADEDAVADYLTDGEVVCIPWGGNAIVQYYKGKFITGDNRIATSSDVNVLSNKYLYYLMQENLYLILLLEVIPAHRCTPHIFIYLLMCFCRRYALNPIHTPVSFTSDWHGNLMMHDVHTLEYS